MYSAFKNEYDRFIIGYSYKTNYLPFLIEEMNRLGAYAEVVSRLEYDLALKIGTPPNKIIFNGPLKSFQDIREALYKNSIINLDSFYEVDIVRTLADQSPDREFKVGLRVNFDISVEGQSSLQSGYKQSRFGFCLENGNLYDAINDLTKCSNVKVIGLHGHFSTSNRSTQNFGKITHTLCDIAKQHLNETLEYIDVGGGFFGHVPKEFNRGEIPSFKEYAKVIGDILNKEKEHFTNDITLIIEPGLAIVVDTFTFISKVIDVKNIMNELFVLVDGSIYNIKPSFHTKNMPMGHFQKSGTRQEGRFNVVGYTCMEKDYLANKYEGVLPAPGDYLSFSNVGAYTIVFHPPFIKERPPILAYENHAFQVIRKRESLNEFVSDTLHLFSNNLT